MFTKIIVLLDGSPLAEWALPTAIALAQRIDAHLTLIRGVELDALVGDPTNGIDQAIVTQDIDAAATEYMAKLQRTLTNPAQPTALAPERLHTRTILGSGTQSLLDAIATEKPDMIVMTTHARAGFSRVLLGSVAANITRKAQVPVLLLRPEENNPPPVDLAGPILVTLDGTPEAETILEPVIALAQTLQTTIALLQGVVPVSSIVTSSEFETYINENADAETEVARQTARAYLAQVRARVAAEAGIACTASVRVESTIVPLIIAYAQEIGAGMLAMATHARGRMGEVVLGSVADGVLHSTHLPVLVTHSQSHSTGERKPSAVAVA